MRQSRMERALVPWMPCMVTGLRIALAPVIAFLFAHHFVEAAVVLFAIAVWTDWLDGALARALGAASDFGAFLDAAADKALVLLFLFVAHDAVYLTLHHWWFGYMHAVWALVAIEAALIALRLPRLFSPRVNVHAGKMGKAKMIAEVAVVFEIMVFTSAELLPVAIGLGALSLIEHLVHYRKQ